MAKEVASFNQSLPSKVKSAFDDKLKELTKQHSIFVVCQPKWHRALVREQPPPGVR